MRTASISIGDIPEKNKLRFWERVSKDGPEHPTNPELGKCWVWTAGLYNDGYGQFFLMGIGRRAHNVSFILAGGTFSDGPLVLHSCHNRKCVNPTHLRSGTNKQNSEDMTNAGRQARHFGDANGMRKHPERVPRGETHSFAKLSDENVAEIKRQYAARDSTQLAIAGIFGITQGHVSEIIHNKKRKCVTQLHAPVTRLWP